MGKNHPGTRRLLRQSKRLYRKTKKRKQGVLIKNGHGIACFIADSVFSSDGIYEIPNDFLKKIYQEIRSFGGVVIADEVQSGFGRLGEKMWGYQDDAVVPDIITMGKPMGNGHPVSALLTHKVLIDSLDHAYNGNSYFNTFGGNPVSAAAALAVLDILEEDNLIDNAREVGHYLKKQLEIAAKENDSVIEIVARAYFWALSLMMP